MPLQLKKQEDDAQPQETQQPAEAAAAAPPPAPAPKPAAPAPAAAAPQPAAAAPPPADIDPNAGAEAADGAGDGEGEDEEFEEFEHEPGRVFQAFDNAMLGVKKFFALLFKHKKLVIAAVVLAAVGTVGYRVALTAYYSKLQAVAGDSYESGNYKKVIEDLDNYASVQSLDAGDTTILARSYIYLEQFDEARQVLEDFAEESPDAEELDHYITAAVIGIMQNDRDQAQIPIERLYLREKDSMTGRYLRAAVFYYIDNDMPQTINALKDIKELIASAAPSKLGQTKADMDFIRDVLYGGHPATISENIPTPFLQLKEVADVEAYRARDDDQLLDLPPTAAGFYNLYYVPTNRQQLYDEEMTVIENVLLLQAVAALHEDDTEQAKTYLDELHNIKSSDNQGDTLYYLYLLAFWAVKSGDYEQAADIYRQLQERNANIDANLMLASALWASGGGVKPSHEVMNLYTETIAMQSDNVPAITNLSFMHIYLGNLDEARKLLESSTDTSNQYLRYNTAYLDFIGADYEKVIDTLFALRANSPSFPLESLLVHALIAEGEYNQAAAELDGLKERDIASPDTYILAANLYREREQPLLVLPELEEGRAAFPENVDLMVELLFEYASRGELEKYAQLRKSVPDLVRQQDYRALMAAAIAAGKEPKLSQNYNDAFNRADKTWQKKQVLVLWLRNLFNIEDEAGRQNVINIAEDFYKDSEVPQEIAILRLRHRSLSADEAEKKQLRIELILLDLLLMPVDSYIDAAYAMIALGEPNQAIGLLEPLPAPDPPARLDALRAAYIAAGDSEKAALIEQRQDVLNQEESTQEEREEVLRAARNVQRSGLAFSTAGESGLSGVGQGRSDVIAAGKGDFVRQLNEAVKQQDYDTAIAIYDELFLLDEMPYTPAIMHQNRGVLYLKNKQFPEAVADLNKALTFDDIRDQDRINILFNKALAEASNGKFQDGIKSVREMLVYQPENMRALVLYTRLLNRVKDYPKLISVYNDIIKLAPGQINAYLGLAEAHRSDGDVDGAIKALQTGLEIAPREKALHSAISKLYALSGDLKRSREHVDIIKTL